MREQELPVAHFYTHVHTHTHTCVHTCMCIQTDEKYINVHVHTFTRTHTYIHGHTHTHFYTRVCVYKRKCAHIHVHACTRFYVNLWANTRTHTHVLRTHIATSFNYVRDYINVTPPHKTSPHLSSATSILGSCYTCLASNL